MHSTPLLLTTLNARYHHASFGLRYLYANLKELQPLAQMVEFTISKNPRDIAEAILEYRPKVVGFGVYIWNTKQTEEVVSLLKRIAPEILIVLGGPEVSHETASQRICQLADYTIQGEADFLFYEFCQRYFGEGQLPFQKIIQGPLPEIRQIASPYAYYTDEDIKNRVLYVEASRGCPYKCEFCLSSLDKSVRNFDLDSFLNDMEQLLQRGARQFKFVDRTFNLSVPTSTRILQFFLDRIHLNLFLHFEMVPDRLPPELRDLIQQFPEGSLQFEIGIQTWNPQVAAAISRRQDYSKIRENFSFLTKETGVHMHADLIVGLPGETLESFAEGFDAVANLEPHEIQVGILKRLKGTPIVRHDQTWEMVYQEHPPFQIIQSKTMSFAVLQKMNRFAQFWDLYVNSGNFKMTMQYLKLISSTRDSPSWFWEFFRFSEFLSPRHAQGNGIALINLVQSAWVYLTEYLQRDSEEIRTYLIADYTGQIKRDIPPFLKGKTPVQTATKPFQKNPTPKRQQKHLGNQALVNS